jgi:hypothetical protein
MKVFAEKIADRVRKQIDRHGCQPMAIHAVSRQGREHYQEFSIPVGAISDVDRDEVEGKMRDWIDRKHIVRYAFVSEVWTSSAKTGRPSQQIDKKEVVMIEVADKATFPRGSLGFAVITRPDDSGKPVLGTFDWHHGSLGPGRFTNLFLPKFPPARAPGELAGWFRCLAWHEPQEKVWSAHLMRILEMMWEHAEGDDVAAKTNFVLKTLSEMLPEVLPVLIAETIERDEAKAEALADATSRRRQQQPIADDHSQSYPMMLPGYASRRARQAAGLLLRALGQAQDIDHLNDNILAGFCVVAGQLARIPDTEERNRMVSGATDFIGGLMRQNLDMMNELKASGIRVDEIVTALDEMGVVGEKMELPEPGKVN